MSRPDYTELLRSPLDDRPETWPWWPLVVSLVSAAAVAALVVAVGSSGATVTTTATSEAPGPAIVVEETPFPLGYVQISRDVAVRAERPIDGAGRLLVPMTMAVRRGVAPETAARPLGGRWQLMTSTGPVESAALHYDRLRPGVFSIEFPEPSATPGGLRLVELWSPSDFEGEQRFAWNGVPFSLGEPLVFPVGSGAELTIDTIDLSTFLGELEWRLSGTEFGLVETTLELLTPDGGTLGVYATSAPSRDPTRLEDRLNYFWPFFSRVDTAEAQTLVVRVRGQLGERIPVDIEVPLGEA